MAIETAVDSHSSLLKGIVDRIDRIEQRLKDDATERMKVAIREAIEGVYRELTDKQRAALRGQKHEADEIHVHPSSTEGGHP